MKQELKNLITDVRGKTKVHKSKKYKTRKLTDITSIAIHHSATLSGSAASFANHHVNENDWPGIGYTYVINKNGSIEWCNSLDTVSYHAGSNNKGALGINLVGDFTKEKPTKEQLNSAYLLIEYLTDEVKTAKSIKGHNEYPGCASTACPALNMTDFRNNYNAWLKAQTAAIAPVVPTPTPTPTPSTLVGQITAEKRDIAIKVDGKIVLANGVFSEGTNYVPVRYLEALGFVVGWDSVDKSITLITPEEKEILYKIVQAEAGGEDIKGRILVVNVIMNRVKSKGFPNSIKEVVFEPQQFEPTRNGAYEKAVISDTTKAAVDEALKGADYSEGALYFCTPKAAAASSFFCKAIAEGKIKLLLSHGGHTFYK